MRVTEHLDRANGPLISFEIIPPRRGGDLKSLLALIDELALHKPPFIDITSHAAEMSYVERPGGIERRVRRKRPGTLGVCALIQNKYGIDAVPHLLCQGFTREETEDFLIELRYLGIDNVLALRGDDAGFRKPLEFGRQAHGYATDLIRQIANMNCGRYLDEASSDPTCFCVGAAGYPEKHFEAPNLANDIRHTKDKVDAGAEYIVTQMFFDNRHYFAYVKACREAGIDVPIIPGLKVLTSKRQLTAIPKVFHCEIPSALADEIEAAKPEHAKDVGIAWAVQQSQELLDQGVPAVHFYVMQNADAINGVMAKLKV